MLHVPCCHALARGKQKPNGHVACASLCVRCPSAAVVLCRAVTSALVQSLHGMCARVCRCRCAVAALGSVQVVLGKGFSMLLTHDGSVFSWGVCNEGQLGQGKAVKYVHHATHTLHALLSSGIGNGSVQWYVCV